MTWTADSRIVVKSVNLSPSSHRRHDQGQLTSSGIPYDGRMEKDESNQPSSPSLVEEAARGNDAAWERLMRDHWPRLRRMVALRMDPRLQGRLDPSDVVQESYIDAARRLSEYTKNPAMPFFIWLRWLVGQRLMAQHRRHWGAQPRDASREVSLYHGALPEATAADLAANVL